MAYQKKIMYFHHFWLQKTSLLGKNAAKIRNFEKLKKVPLDIFEIHVVSKFGPISIKIGASSLLEHNNNSLFSTLYTNILTYLYTQPPFYQPTTPKTSTQNILLLTNVLLPNASRRLKR